MKFSAIIGIIIIIILFTSSIPVINEYKPNYGGTVNSALLTNNNITYCPVNSTACQFSLTSDYGNLPMNVRAGDFYNESFLRANLKESPSWAYELKFSWNFNMSYSLSNVKIIFNEGNLRMFCISFGVNNRNILRLNYGSGIEFINESILQNKEYELQIGFSRTLNMAYISLGSSGENSIHVPYIFSTSSLYSSTADNYMEFGGNYYNLTLYSLKSVNGSFPVLNSPARIDPYSRAFTIPESLGALIAIRPYFDRIMNTVIFDSAHSINFMNVVNGSTWHDNLTVRFGHPVSWINIGENLYTLYRNESRCCIISLNLSTLSIFNYSSTLNCGNGSFTRAGDHILIIEENGTMESLSPNTGLWTLLTPGIESGIVIYSEPTWNNTKFDIYNQTDNVLASYTISSDLEITSNSVSNFTRYGKPNIHIWPEENGIIDSSISEQKTPPGVLWFNQNLIFPNGTFLWFTHENLWYMSNGSVILSNSSESLEISSNFMGTSSFSYFDSYSILIGMNSSEITVSNLSGAGIYVGHSPTISVPKHPVLTGITYLNFSINSSFSYTSTLNILGKNIRAINGSNFRINTYSFQNGYFPYELRVKAENGFSTNMSGDITIDNAKPLSDLSIQENSTVFPGELLNLTVNDPVGIAKIEFGFNHTVSETSGNAIEITVPKNYEGNFIFFNYTVFDYLGLEFNYSIFYHYIKENHSLFSSSIMNGAYFKQDSFNLTFSSLGNVSYYIIKINRHNSTIFNETTEKNMVNIENIGNGRFSMIIEGRYSAGNVVVLQTANFSVISFNPGISYSFTNDTYYSFTGNSVNNSLNLLLYSNISSVIHLNITGENGKEVLYGIYGNFVNFSLNSSSAQFLQNGLYFMNMKIISLSGTVSYFNASFAVNNTIPSLNLKTTYFVNYSAIALNIPDGLKAKLTSVQGGISFTNGSIQINRTGTYMGRITVVSNSLNYATKNILIYYYTSKPIILIETNNYSIVLKNKSIALNFSITDRTPIIEKYFILGKNKIQLSGNSIDISPPGDGLFNISIYAMDACGNQNISLKLKIMDEYFPDVTSSSITGFVIGKYPSLTVNLRGFGLSKVNITWFVNDREAGSGIRLNGTLPLGYDFITVHIQFGNQTIIDSYSTISITNLPIMIPIIIIGAFFTVRILKRTRNKDKIELFLNGVEHISLGDLRKHCKELNLSFRSVGKVIKEKVSNGTLKYGLDLDGKKFVMKKQ
ncbi:MAG: hypothetical protein M1159_03650 [Candidatus Thermoplasmatota archaeon]|nr:hypothetical protein [Candidatus Thermoplasmatota archaeon]